jgi:hypothetical protein
MRPSFTPIQNNGQNYTSHLNIFARTRKPTYTNTRPHTHTHTHSPHTHTHTHHTRKHTHTYTHHTHTHTHTARSLSISAVQVKCTESSRLSHVSLTSLSLSLSRLPLYQATRSLPRKALRIASSHLRSTRRDANVEHSKSNWKWNSHSVLFCRAQWAEPNARQEASRQLLFDIHNSGVQWARTAIGPDRGAQPLSPELQVSAEKL